MAGPEDVRELEYYEDVDPPPADVRLLDEDTAVFLPAGETDEDEIPW